MFSKNFDCGLILGLACSEMVIYVGLQKLFRLNFESLLKYEAERNCFIVLYFYGFDYAVLIF